MSSDVRRCLLFVVVHFPQHFASRRRGTLDAMAPRRMASAGGASAPSTAATTAPQNRVQRAMSDRRALGALERIAQGQKNDDKKDHLADVVTDLKGDAELVDLVRGVIRRHKRKAHAQQKLRRGVRCLKDLPQYALQSILATISGRDEATFTQLSDPDRRGLLYWALNADPHFLLSKKEMTLDELTEWAEQRHEQEGHRLKEAGEYILSDHTVDWELGIVFFSI